MNMSYCKFQNTLTDLRDCYSTMNDLAEEHGYLNEEALQSLGHEERHALECMLELVKNVAQEFGEDA